MKPFFVHLVTKRNDPFVIIVVLFVCLFVCFVIYDWVIGHFHTTGTSYLTEYVFR